MKITYNTPISDIIDPNEVHHIFYTYEQNTTKKLLKKGQAIDEQTAGSKGFSKESCRINGTTILYNKARAIAKLAERTYKEEDSIRTGAVEKAKDQREKELKLLHTAIANRIEELQKEKDNLISKLNELNRNAKIVGLAATIVNPAAAAGIVPTTAPAVIGVNQKTNTQIEFC